MKISQLFLKSFLSLTLLTTISCRQEDSKSSAPVPAADTAGGPTQTQAQAGGGGTDVGSGGNGAEAEWKSITAELAEKLRLLNRAPIELELFNKIKKNFPELVQKTTVSFKNYPLIHGVETATEDNPSKLETYKSPSCENLKTTNSENEKDAINFSSNNLIKVNGPKFYCYPKNKNEVRRLIIHEYLGLMGISERADGKTGYEITNALLKSFESLPKFDEARDVVMIHTCQELQDMGLTDLTDVAEGYMTPVKIWRLANDIDCSESASLNNGNGFRPLIVWGHVDGNGYAIRNLKITNQVSLEKQLQFPDTAYETGAWINYKLNKSKALFYINCKECHITNLSLLNADVEGGALLVIHNEGSIRNVSVQGRVHGAFRVMGGLVSENSGTISQSTANVEVLQTPFSPEERLNQFAEGFLGNSVNGSIAESTMTAKVQGVEFVGGFAAHFENSIASNINMSARLKADNYWSLAGLVATNTQSSLRNFRAQVQIQPGPAARNKLRMYLAGAVGKITKNGDAKADLRLQSAEISYLDVHTKICGAEGETLDNKVKEIDDDLINELRVSKDFGALSEITLTSNQIQTEFVKTCSQ